MAFQGGKIKDIKKRHMMYEWLDNLEFVLLDLPRPDMVLFLYLPYEEVCSLKIANGNKVNENILRMAEIAYFELSNIYDYQKIMCLKDNRLRDIKDIANEILMKVQNFLETEG